MTNEKAFALEYVELCRKYKLAFAHEDAQGEFLITSNHLEDNIIWAVGDILRKKEEIKSND